MTFSAVDSSLTGPLFATETMGEVFSDQARLRAMLRMEAALARVQARRGLAPQGLADALDALSPDLFDLDALGRETALAGVPTIPFVKAVQARLPNELERAFHKGATTQDVADTALVLQIREALNSIRSDLVRIIAGLERLADQHRGTPCVGRTYGQHAAPVTFGFKAAVWLSGIVDAAANAIAEERVLVVSLGGPVGTLAGLREQVPRSPTRSRTNSGCDRSRSPGTPSTRMVETGTWLAILMGALAKMATDVAHLASTEVGEVSEPYMPGRGGSSAMPHKRNPVSSTIILAAHAAAKGHVTTLLDGMAAAHERPVGLSARRVARAAAAVRTGVGCVTGGAKSWPRGWTSTRIECAPISTPLMGLLPTPSARLASHLGARRRIIWSNKRPAKCSRADETSKWCCSDCLPCPSTTRSTWGPRSRRPALGSTALSSRLVACATSSHFIGRTSCHLSAPTVSISSTT